MDPFEYGKLLESMGKYGFVDPLTVRPDVEDMWEIIDGEHRLQAAEDLGMKTAPYMNVGPISTADAQALGIIMNELKGRHDPKKLGALLDDLLTNNPVEDVLRGMPFTDEALAGLTSLKSFDWDTLESPTTEKDPSPKKGTSWVERTFRLPQDANDVLSAALERAKDGDDIEDWQALERVAADFLSG